MSDVASGDPTEPSGPRRSSFTPPPPGTEPPVFDDDALADALAAEVAPYTSPIDVVPAAEPPVAEPAALPEPALPEPVVPDAAPEPVATPSGSSPTLEAIERLESELRRRAEESRSTGPTPTGPALADPTPAPPPAGPPPVSSDEPAPRLFPAPPTFLRTAPPDGSVLPPPPAAEPEPPVFAPSAPEPPAFAPPAPEPPTFPAPEPPAFAPPAPEPPSFPAPEPPAFGPADPPVPPAPPENAVPLDPPFWDSPPPPNFTPPSLVEPPAPVTGPFPVFAPHPQTPAFGIPPLTPPVDLPPPGTSGPADYAHLPPPVGLQPAALPPYQPTGEIAAPGPLAPPPADFGALLSGPGLPPPHPDDLGAGESVPGVPVADEAEPAIDDAVDEIDSVLGTGAIVVDSTGAVAIVHPPSQPIPTLQVTEGEVGLLDPEPQRHPALVVETAGLEPTALDLRAGRAARMFWLWFATNSSVVSLSLGAVLFGLGMSLRQAVVAIVIGVALSFLPLGLVTLAGKWSGQPTMVVSRASFGLAGNVLPTLLSIVSRVFWGGALLWLLAVGVARVLVDAGLDAGLGEPTWTFVALGVGFVLAFVVAIFGYGLVARVQLVLSIVTGILVVGVIVLTSARVDLDAALQSEDGPWILLVTGVVLVFSFVGLAWVHSSADLARYQRPESDGGSNMLWATLGATLPALLLIVWGALLAASDPIVADGLATNPLHTIAALLPIWYPAPLIAAIALGLLSGVVLTIYSGGFALQALGVTARRPATTVIAGVLVLALGAALLVLAGDARDLIRDAATTIAVPVAAWAGIFAAEMMIRRRGFDSESLIRRGGVYPAVRWANLIGLVVIAAIGFGLTSAVLPGLDWQGYLFPLFGLDPDDALATSDVGVLVALGLGILLPIVTGIPAIRRQERALGDDPAAP